MTAMCDNPAFSAAFQFQIPVCPRVHAGGEKCMGRISNEDNFSLQLQTLDGGFLFVSRSDLENVESNSQGLMPSDYASTLSAAELNDVISYLMSVATVGKPEHSKKSDEWRD